MNENYIDRDITGVVLEAAKFFYAGEMENTSANIMLLNYKHIGHLLG